MDEESSATADALWRTLAQQLRAARTLSGLTIERFIESGAINYSVSHISNLERGVGRPSRELVAVYDRLFSLEPDKTRLVRLWDDADATKQAEKQAQHAKQARSKGLDPTPSSTAAPAVPRQPPRAASGRRRGWTLGIAGAVILLAIATVVVIVLATRPSVEEFARRADKICGAQEQPLRALQAGLSRVGALLAKGDPRAGRELASQIAAVGAIKNEAVKRLKALDRPSGGAGETARDFVKGTEDAAFQGLNILTEMAESIAAGENQQALQHLTERSDFDATALRRDGLARELGAKVCARVGLRRPWGRPFDAVAPSGG